MSRRGMAAESPGLLRLCAWMGWLGAAALCLAILVAPFFVPDYYWLSDTISDLGAGEHEWIVDFGLYGYAGGLMFLAVAAAHMYAGDDNGWVTGLLILLFLAVVVTIVGARNEYGDGDNEGVVIHIYLVYLLGLGYAVAPAAMARQVGGRMKWVFYGLALLWVVMAPFFFFLPTGIDGLYERLLGVVALGWTSCLAWVFRARSHGRV